MICFQVFLNSTMNLKYTQTLETKLEMADLHNFLKRDNYCIFIY